MRVEIVNWDKYNPRSEAKAWSWFRMQNGFFTDPDFHDVDETAKLVFLYLLCERSETAKETFKVNPRLAATLLGSNTTVGAVEAAILNLVDIGKIKVHDEPSRTHKHADVRERTPTRADVRERTHTKSDAILPFPTDGRTDETDVTDVTNETRRDGTDETNGSADLLPEARPAPRKARAPTGGSEVWAAYAAAYEARYGHAPVRNARTNAQCSQLVGRLGLEAAVNVVRFYLTHQGRFYVQTCHALGACLKDAEGLHTQMLAGVRVTGSDAQQQDRRQATLGAFERVARKLKAEAEAKEAARIHDEALKEACRDDEAT